MRHGRLLGIGGGVRVISRAMLGAMALMSLPAVALTPEPQALRIFSIDVEGGAATLYVTPQGHSLLIDTGWPAGMGGMQRQAGDALPAPVPSSAQRIATVAHAAGIGRIDYLLLSHYHVDHSGGVAELATLMPIGVFIDHGPVREFPRENATPAQRATSAATLYARYIATVGTRPHHVLKPGDAITIDDLTVSAIDSDRATVDAPLAGTGEPSKQCGNVTAGGDLGGEENPRSLGIVAAWGKARIMSLGDTTWDIENRLVCPRNLIGPIDLMFIGNHGTANSNTSTLLDSISPTVVIINNGPVKGADGATLDRLAAIASIKGVWQLHYADRTPGKNTADNQIANLDAPDRIDALRIEVRKDGSIKVTNPRTDFTKIYPSDRK